MAGEPRVFSTAGSLFALHGHRIEEVINSNVDVILPSLDPVWRDTIVTSQGVGPSDALGRDMVILRVFQGAMAGVLEQAKPRGDFVLFGDDTDELGQKLYTQNLTRTFPDPLDGPNANPYRLGIPMRAMVTNIMFTMGELQAEALPAFIGAVIAPKLEGFARNISHTLCNYFYLSQNASYQLGGLGGVNVATDTNWYNAAGSAGGADGNNAGPFFLDFSPPNQATDRFYVGQRVDIFTNNGATRINQVGAGNVRWPLFVARVDEMTNTVTLVAPEDSPDDGTNLDASVDFAGTSGTGNEIVVYANSRDASAPNYTGIAGINSWLKGGGVSDNDRFLLGPERLGASTVGANENPDAISVDEHPEHKSFLQSLGGQVLTEHRLRQYLRRFHAAKNKYGYYIDCLIASEGVWLGYESTKIGRERIERAGRLSSLKKEGSDNKDLGYGGFTFFMDGREYMGYESCYIEDGTLYGIRKGGNNWKRYVPPDPRGTRSFDRTEPFIPFKFVSGILTGLGTSQLPIYDTSGSRNLVTEGSQMPGMLRMQLVPDQFCGLKLMNVGTDKVYSDDTIATTPASP